MTEGVKVMSLAPFRNPERIRDVQVLHCGHLPAKRERVHHTLTYHALVLVVSGRGDFRTDRTPLQTVGPGSLFVLHPGPAFHFGPPPGRHWEEYHLCLHGAGLQRWIDRGWLPCDRWVHQLATPSPLVWHFERIRSLLRRLEPGDQDRSALAAAQLLLEADHQRQQQTVDLPGDTAIRGIHRHLREHYDEDIDFADLAARRGMSYSLLRQRLRRLTGLPPQQYLTRLRCEAAQRLLTESDLPIARVGELVGIADPYVFSRTFKRVVGRSPRRFRQEMAPWQ